MEILNEFKDTKTIVVLEKEEDKKSIYHITKQQINEEERDEIINIIKQSPDQNLIMINDKYHKYQIDLTFNNIKTSYVVDTISPATDKDVDKNRSQIETFFTETIDMFNRITLPFVKSIPQSEYQWIYNILDGKAEQENVLLDTDKYQLALDMKWDRKNVKEVYGTVFVKDYSLHSLRALNQSHLPLLEELQQKTLQILNEKYGLKESEVITFVHYIPSFWILHVHFVTIHSPRYRTANCVIGRAITLNDVIQNIKMKNDYYQTVDLRVKLFANHPLYESFMKENE